MAKMYIIIIALHRAHELFVIYTFDHSVQNFLVSTLDISLLDVTGATRIQAVTEAAV